MVLVSAYTLNTPYEEEIANLLASLSKYPEIHKKIYALIDLGTWEKNCQQKAITILKALNEFQEGILWVDADAIVDDDLSFFNNLDCDVSCYYLKTPWNPSELLSGTIYFGNTEKAREILNRWITLNETNSVWDQKNLQLVLNSTPCNKVSFPSDYIVVDKIHYNHQKDVVKHRIYHTQASRRLRPKK